MTPGLVTRKKKRSINECVDVAEMLLEHQSSGTFTYAAVATLCEVFGPPSVTTRARERDGKVVGR